MNKTNGFLSQGVCNLLVEVTSQQENKRSHVDLHTITGAMKGLYRQLLSQRIIVEMIRERDMEAETLKNKKGRPGVDVTKKMSGRGNSP